MCGIAGVLMPYGPADEAVLRRMAVALAHRGPDDVGITWWGRWASPTCGCPSSTSRVDTSPCSTSALASSPCQSGEETGAE
jgi:asparagine synthetase B (glutamine-hydrolysing)